MQKLEKKVERRKGIGKILFLNAYPSSKGGGDNTLQTAIIVPGTTIGSGGKFPHPLRNSSTDST